MEALQEAVRCAMRLAEGAGMRPDVCLYVLFSCLAVAFLLLWRRRYMSRHARNWRKARRLYRHIRSGSFDSPGSIMRYLRKIDPFVFEELVLYSFSRCGYAVCRNRRYTGDGGIDGRMRKGTRRYLLQMKRYSGYISIAHVKDFMALCRKSGRIGVFVHTGRTGDGVWDYVTGCGGMYIISGEGVLRLIRDGEDVLQTDFRQRRLSLAV